MPFVRMKARTAAAPAAAVPQAATQSEEVSASDIPNYHPNDALANIIVKAWRDEGFKARLMANAKQVFEENNLFFPRTPRVVEWVFFQQPVNEFDIDDPHEQLFVLPPKPDNLPGSGDVLDSARAAMAYTPVGI